MNNIVVATECPSCGAPLDFSEGSNAVKCQHCLSNLMVTGRKQVLSYYVPPKLDERRAVATAVMAQRNLGRDDFRGITPCLYFLPYYRMTGQDFGWEEAPKPKPDDEQYMDKDSETNSLMGLRIKVEIKEDDGYLFGDTPSLRETAGELWDILFHKKNKEHSIGFETNAGQQESRPELPENRRSASVPSSSRCRPSGGSLYEKGEVVLNDRYIEKNFLACELQGLGIYSLGIRPAVLRLQLFSSEALKDLGKTVSPSLGPEAAESVGMKTLPDAARLCRQVIGKVLSIIYFPFWVVGIESRGKVLLTVVDAVSESVVKADAPPSLNNTLAHTLDAKPMVVGFRPLTCPNCGWDLPVRPDDSIFFCNSCSRAWQICGAELCEIGFKMADTGTSEPGATLKYLPFWVFNSGKEEGRSVFIPAFRYRRLKLLLDLALRLTRIQPAFSFAEPAKDDDLSGCYYDSEDAGLLAGFMSLMLASGQVAELGSRHEDASALSDPTLIWLPFKVQGEYLVSPYGGINIPKNMLM